MHTDAVCHNNSVDEYACECSAKVNLSLAILSFDPDARMHAVDTVMAKISLADTVSLQIREGHGVVVDISSELASDARPSVDPGENSITRAYQELDTRAGGELPGMLLRVIKRIPTGSGLGGGSSDAAGFLRMVREMAALDAYREGSLARLSQLSDSDWLELAARVGADVPAFMLHGPVRARGFGEQVESIALSGLGEYCCVLGVPEASFSTASMYAKVRSHSSYNHTQGFLDEWHTGSPKAAFRVARNDFTSIARDISSEVGDLLDTLTSFGYPLVSVTGSGSCVFAVAKTEEADGAHLPVYDFVG